MGRSTSPRRVTEAEVVVQKRRASSLGCGGELKGAGCLETVFGADEGGPIKYRPSLVFNPAIDGVKPLVSGAEILDVPLYVLLCHQG